MTHMHPHWQATDEDAPVGIPVDSMSATPVREAIIQPRPMVRTASRKPAAILGILMVMGVGYVAMGGEFSLPGQVASGSVSIVLTKDGPDPKSLRVSPGVTVEWKNQDTIPHVLSFESLVSGGKELETSPIFPGSTALMLIPKETKTGTYEYLSKTSDLGGTIVIVAPGAAAASSSKAPAAIATVSSVSSAMAAKSSSPAALPASAVIPVNIHTVGSPGQKPVEPLHGGAPLAAVMQHKPMTNAASGPANWVLIGMTAVIVLFATRKAFR